MFVLSIMPLGVTLIWSFFCLFSSSKHAHLPLSRLSASATLCSSSRVSSSFCSKITHENMSTDALKQKVNLITTNMIIDYYRQDLSHGLQLLSCTSLFSKKFCFGAVQLSVHLLPLQHWHDHTGLNGGATEQEYDRIRRIGHVKTFTWQIYWITQVSLPSLWRLHPSESACSSPCLLHQRHRNLSASAAGNYNTFSVILLLYRI